jgi:hypothetical protein
MDDPEDIVVENILDKNPIPGPMFDDKSLYPLIRQDKKCGQQKGQGYPFSNSSHSVLPLLPGFTARWAHR